MAGFLSFVPLFLLGITGFFLSDESTNNGLSKSELIAFKLRNLEGNCIGENEEDFLVVVPCENGTQFYNEPILDTGGLFVLAKRFSGLPGQCLTVEAGKGSKVRFETCNPNDSQILKIGKENEDETGYFQVLQGPHANSCLTAEKEKILASKPCKNGKENTSQFWKYFLQ